MLVILTSSRPSEANASRLKGSPSLSMASARIETASRSTSRMVAPDAQPVARRFRDIDQQQRREIAVHRGRGAEYARVGLATAAQRDAGVEHGVDVEIVALVLAVEADACGRSGRRGSAGRCGCAATCGTVERFLDPARLAETGATSRTTVHSGRSMACARSHSGYLAMTTPRWSGGNRARAADLGALAFHFIAGRVLIAASPAARS